MFRRNGRRSFGPADRRRSRFRDALRQPRICRQHVRSFANAVQRTAHAVRGHPMDGEKPARVRGRNAAKLRRTQRRTRALFERCQTVAVLPFQNSERAGRCRHLRPERAGWRLLDSVFQRFDGLLPQPAIRFSGTLPLDPTARHLRRTGSRLGRHAGRDDARKSSVFFRPAATLSVGGTSDTPFRSSISPCRSR